MKQTSDLNYLEVHTFIVSLGWVGDNIWIRLKNYFGMSADLVGPVFLFHMKLNRRN